MVFVLAKFQRPTVASRLTQFPVLIGPIIASSYISMELEIGVEELSSPNKPRVLNEFQSL